MVKPLRLRLAGNPFSRIKEAECFTGHPVHIFVHGIHISAKKGLYKIIIVRQIPGKPSGYHIPEHKLHFIIGQCQFIPWLFYDRICFVFLIAHHFQVAARHKEAPDRVLIMIQLIIDNLLINRHKQMSSCQQALKRFLHTPSALPDQLPDQAVGTGVRPVHADSFFIKIIQNRPGIIDILPLSKDKTVIPALYPLFFLQSIFIHGGKNFFFCKAKCRAILADSHGHYLKVVQIRENGFPADPRDPGHDRPFQMGIGLKRGIEHTPCECHELFPVSPHIGLLHRRVVLIQ